MSAERTGRILVADDDPPSRELMSKLLRSFGHTVTALADGLDLIEAVRRDPSVVDLVVSDVRMARSDGFQVLESLKRDAPEIPVVLVTAFGDVEGAIDAIRKGAFDYIPKPYDLDQIGKVTQRALELRALTVAQNARLAGQLPPAPPRTPVFGSVGKSPLMVEVVKTAARAASSDAPVLLLGQSGTGKSLLAKTIHEASRRKEGPFIQVDCGTLSEGLLESELFGHVRGAFTGADQAREGLIAAAHGGTLFLDEIGNVGPKLQAQLLRVLQEGEVRPVGSNQARKVDVRIVAATNADLAARVKQGAFREDLFYRLDVVTLRVPELARRREDIADLARFFLAKHGRERSLTLSDAALAALEAYGWPGNVRELENTIERAIALCPSDLITPDDLPETLRGAVPAPVGPAPAPQGLDALLASLHEQGALTLAQLDRAYALVVLDRAGGNKSRAAELLGIDRKTLYRLLE